MLSEVLWQWLDVSSILTICGLIMATIKYGKSYMNNIQTDLKELNGNVTFICEDIKDIKLTMLINDIKVMIKNDVGKEDVARAYDSYNKLGGNGFIKKEVEDYLNV